MRCNEEVVAIADVKLVHLFNGLVGLLGFLETHITLVLKELVRIGALDVGGHNFSELLKVSPQPALIRALWDTLDEDVGSLVLVTLALVTLQVSNNLGLLAVDVEASLSNGLLSGFLIFELDIAKTLALAFAVRLELARHDLSIDEESIVELLLGGALVDVLHVDVRLGVDEVVLLHIAAN